MQLYMHMYTYYNISYFLSILLYYYEVKIQHRKFRVITHLDPL